MEYRSKCIFMEKENGKYRHVYKLEHLKDIDRLNVCIVYTQYVDGEEVYKRTNYIPIENANLFYITRKAHGFKIKMNCV